MVATALTRLGQANKAGDVLVNFLKVFGGEVFTSFHENLTMTPSRHRFKQIKHGKTAQFPLIGQTAAVYHEPGDNIIEDTNGGTDYLTGVPMNEAVIHIDKKLTTAIMLDELDDAMNHFETRQHLSKEMGVALAEQMDRQLIQLTGLAAGAAALVTGGGIGTTLDNGAISHAATTGSDILGALYEMAQAFDEKKIPASQRWCVMRPDMFYKLIQETGGKLLDQDFSTGNGDFAKNILMVAAGFNILVSNLVPRSVVATSLPDTRQEYGGTFTKCVAICWHGRATATAQLRGLRFQAEDKIEYQAGLMVASYALGHGIIWPAAAGIINIV